MSFVPTTIATLATSLALEDLRILLGTLELFNANPPTVYLLCDSTVASEIPSMKYSGKVHIDSRLDKYGVFDRQQMEKTPGVHFSTMWFDFMAEKINLLRWALGSCEGVLFCDADICFMGPLPAIPEGTAVALSPHMIAERDEKRYGKYNGGFLWVSKGLYADIWWNACATARYYEQSALEDVASYVLDHQHEGAGTLYEFPKTVNYGWWRLWQGKKSPSELLKEWAMNRLKGKETSGICIEGVPLNSIHTHFRTEDMATKQFNTMVLGWLKILAQHHTLARKLLPIVLVV